jgi:hypothetical protein
MIQTHPTLCLLTCNNVQKCGLRRILRLWKNCVSDLRFAEVVQLFASMLKVQKSFTPGPPPGVRAYCLAHNL